MKQPLQRNHCEYCQQPVRSSLGSTLCYVHTIVLLEGRDDSDLW